MQIAIKFGDNDFQATFKGVLAILLDGFEYNNNLPSSKKELVIIINEIIVGVYLSHQNQFEHSHSGKTMDEYIEHIRKYLTIKEKHILLNEEVQQYINEELEESEYGFGDLYILDTDLINSPHNPIRTF